MSVCIQVINPNTSLAMTETIGAAARAVAAPGTEILSLIHISEPTRPY